MKTIYIYVPEHVVTMSLGLIKDLSWVATKHYLSENSIDSSPTGYIKVIGAANTSVKSFSDVAIQVDGDINTLKEAEALFICAFGGDVSNTLGNNKALIERLPSLHQSGVPIATVSNATYFLAEAGLLNARSATIYPPTANEFARRYPSVDLNTDAAITNAENLYCANGIASGCDLIVSLLERVFGQGIARRISQDFLLGFNREYEIANIHCDGQKYHNDEKILSAQNRIEQEYTEQIQLDSLAEDLGMSARNFSRRFKKATGESPSKYLQKVRIEKAKTLLLNSALNISQICEKTGYSDVSYFTRVFQQAVGCLPNEFRTK